MNSESFSIVLPSSLLKVIEYYKTVYHYQSEAQVVQKALEMLQQSELEEAYRQASEEVDPAWEGTINDGLSDETW